MVGVPAVVRNKALATGAVQWIDDLPKLVASLEREWSITVSEPYSDSTEAFVAEATLEDGTQAVLKLLVPRDGEAARNESRCCALPTAMAACGCYGRMRAWRAAARPARSVAVPTRAPDWATARDSLCDGSEGAVAGGALRP